jgi:hypothetical protein
MGWVLAACLLLFAPPYVIAQSNHYPDDDGAAFPGPYNISTGAPGFVTVSLDQTKCGPVTTNGFSLDGFPTGLTGAEVSMAVSGRLCTNARINGYTCSGTIAAVACAGQACCDFITTVADVVIVDCTKPDPPCNGGGFHFEKDPTDPIDAGFVVSALGGPANKIQGVLWFGAPDPGNTVVVDLLPNWIVRVDPVDPNGIRIDGNLTFGVAVDLDPNTPADTFTVDTNGLSDTALHAAIAAEYGDPNRDNPLLCLVKNEDPNCGDAVVFSGSPRSIEDGSEIYRGAFVFCPGVTGRRIKELSVKGLPGQTIISETTTGPEHGAVPTLSGWGMALLVGTLLVIGAWLLRRRQAGQQT